MSAKYDQQILYHPSLPEVSIIDYYTFPFEVMKLCASLLLTIYLSTTRDMLFGIHIKNVFIYIQFFPLKNEVLSWGEGSSEIMKIETVCTKHARITFYIEHPPARFIEIE